MSTENNPRDQQKLSKEETINLLTDTINQLQDIVTKINDNSLNKLPEKTILNNLLQDSNKLVNSLNLPSTINKKNDYLETDLKSSYDQKSTDILEPQKRTSAKSYSQTKKVPKPKNQFLAEFKTFASKPIIWISILCLAISLIFVPNFLKNSDSSSQLANNPSLESTETINTDINNKPEINLEQKPIIQENLTEKESLNIEDEVKTDIDKNVVDDNQDLVDNNENTIVEVPETIVTEEPVLIETEISPSIEPKLTPEQNLIASIQNQVAQITKKYADGLILKIKANFKTSYLIITLDNSWYDLSENQQDTLTKEILEKTKILDFYKLKIIGVNGDLIARNSVVGDRMIVLKR